MRRYALPVVALITGLSCAGRPEPAAETATAPSAIVGPGSVHAMDDGPVVPTTPPATCPIGTGDVDAVCGEGPAPEMLADVDAAIDELVRTKPELFDLDRVMGSNGYLVRDPEQFHLGVAAVLQAKGLCAEWNYEVFQVKNSQARSEQYDLLLSNDHIRRGAGSYRAACSPASFPLAPAEVIHRVRVAFYSIECADGRTPPRNGEGILPVDCTGYVTATPKKKDDTDVDKRIHGPGIVWELAQPDDYVAIDDFPRVEFNKVLRGRDPGPFELCATVQTRKGCLYGEVVP